jgi:pyruvate, water dikinase
MEYTVIPFKHVTMKNLANVGGKNASLGEMISNLTPLGVQVPDGFAITVSAFFEFLSFNELYDVLKSELGKLDHQTLDHLSATGLRCREVILNSSFPIGIQNQIWEAYQKLAESSGAASFAVRSSATAEDSVTASFAGQHDSFLNVSGFDNLMIAIKKCYASLFNDRAIKYRIDNGFGNLQVGIAVGVQAMVRSDIGSAGVIFTIEPENGNPNLIYVTGAWGLGESVVQGAVNTDEFYLFKKAITDGKQPIVSSVLGLKQQMLVYGATVSGKSTEWKQTPSELQAQYVVDDKELTLLGRWSMAIEEHYGMPMDIEWAKDGITGALYVVQARPETVQSHNKHLTLKQYTLTTDATPLLTGKAVGQSIISGTVRMIKSLADSDKINQGDIIVADITNPDWNALLRKAICIVTNKGGRTSHASIVARELGIPAVVGTITATEQLKDGQVITVSCVNGDEGYIYDGKLNWMETELPVASIAHTDTHPLLILADPHKALLYATYPTAGVGLLRMEFMIINSLKVHPMALVKFDQITDNSVRQQIDQLTKSYTDRKQFFIDKLAESIGLVAAAFYPRQVIVRTSDFKTNEYAKLLGGAAFEPMEENPMLGFRGASRYYDERYKEGFGLECLALKKVREEMGLDNVKVMIPFCRTVEEARKVLTVMKEFGLERGKDELEILVMAEIPSNVLLAKQFAQLFDGFSIGSNDLTQLTLGLDRDSAIVSHLFNENDEAVRFLIQRLVETAHGEGVKVGLCGQAPSDYPEFAQFLVNCGIDSISFNPDALIKGIHNINEAEKRILPVLATSASY